MKIRIITSGGRTILQSVPSQQQHLLPETYPALQHIIEENDDHHLPSKSETFEVEKSMNDESETQRVLVHFQDHADKGVPGDLDMVDAPQEFTNQGPRNSSEDIVDIDKDSGISEGNTSPQACEGVSISGAEPAAENLAVAELSVTNPVEITAVTKGTEPCPKHKAEPESETINSLSTEFPRAVQPSPRGATPESTPRPNPIARFDAIYTLYVDNTYECWSMGLKELQIAGFIDFLKKKPMAEKAPSILRLMEDVKKRKSWEMLVRKEGEEARKARDMAIEHSDTLRKLALGAYGKKDVQELEDSTVAWVHLRDFRDRSREAWMVGTGFGAEDMLE